MISFNNICIVGVDLGYGNIKTARTIFPTGLIVHNTEPIFSGKILQYGSKYYKIGDCHKPFIPDKTADEDFYILTLAAIASELHIYNMYEDNTFLQPFANPIFNLLQLLLKPLFRLLRKPLRQLGVIRTQLTYNFFFFRNYICQVTYRF